MARQKKGVFNPFALVRAMARASVGQPKPTAILFDKRRRKRVLEVDRECKDALKRRP